VKLFVSDFDGGYYSITLRIRWDEFHPVRIGQKDRILFVKSKEDSPKAKNQGRYWVRPVQTVSSRLHVLSSPGVHKTLFR
jgi:hypothetical protein